MGGTHQPKIVGILGDSTIIFLFLFTFITIFFVHSEGVEYFW